MAVSPKQEQYTVDQYVEESLADSAAKRKQMDAERKEMDDRFARGESLVAKDLEKRLPADNRSGEQKRIDAEWERLKKDVDKVSQQDEAARVERNRQQFNRINEDFSPLSAVGKGVSTGGILQMFGVKTPAQQTTPQQRVDYIKTMAQEEDKETAQVKQQREEHQDNLAKQNKTSAKAAQKAMAPENDDSAKAEVNSATVSAATPFQAPTLQPPNEM